MSSRSSSRGSSRSRSKSRSRSYTPRRRYSYSRSRSPSYSPRRRRSYTPSPRRRRSYSRSPRRRRSFSPFSPRRRRSYSRSYSRSRSRSYSRSRSPYYRRRRKPSYSPRRYHRDRSPMSNRRRHVGNRYNPTPNNVIGIFGLSLTTEEKDLRDILERFGDIKEIQIVYDHQTGRSRGFAFVYFEDIQDAIEAKEQCNGIEVDGRKIRVDFSITKRPHTPTPGVYMGKPTRPSRDGYRDKYDDYDRDRDRNHDRGSRYY